MPSVGAVAEAEGGFGGNEHFVAASGDGFAENGFSVAGGVDIGAVEHVETGFQADVDEAGGFLHAAGAEGGEQLSLNSIV